MSAVLLHEELLGDDDEPGPAPRRRRRRLDAPRLAAGLAAAGVTLPVISLLWAGNLLTLLPLACLTAATGVLGSFLSHEATRRELLAHLDRFRARASRLFADGAPAPAGDAADLGTALDNLTRSVERTLEGRLRRERDAFIATITSLVSALEARDPYTRNHSTSVAKLSVRIAMRMGLSREDLYEVHLGGLLHDIGKIGIRDDILLKPAGLTREEYEIMKSHPVLGARILSGLPGFERVRDMVLYHHEMYDGRGYPDGRAGEDIPMGARIVAVADTYLSLVEDRPYRPAREFGKVIAELRRVAGRQLDPDVLEALFALIREEAQPGREIPDAEGAREAAEITAPDQRRAA